MTAPPADYAGRLRDLLVASLCWTRIRAAPHKTDFEHLRRDVVRVCEFFHDTHLAAVGPPPADPPAAWVTIAEDIAGCVMARQWGRLRPTDWGVRELWREWYAMGWAGRFRMFLWRYAMVTVGPGWDRLCGGPKHHW